MDNADAQTLVEGSAFARQDTKVWVLSIYSSSCVSDLL